MFETALLHALTSAKCVSNLCALLTRPNCPAINSDLSREVLRPNLAFMPNIIKSSYRSRILGQWAFSHPPHDGESEERLHRLCPVHALVRYVAGTTMIRSPPQLFVCYGAGALGPPLSKKSLAHDGIALAYETKGRPVTSDVRAHCFG